MKKLALTLPLLLVLAAPLTARGDDDPAAPLPPPAAESSSRAQEISPLEGPPAVAADVWRYMQEMRRYDDDPQQAVRQKAERKAEQRRARMAALKWYGYSASRPQASPTPFMGTYSPRWIGNSGHPFGWVPTYHPHVIRVDRTETRR